MKKNSVLIYIGLAMGITWLLWIPALILVAHKGYSLPTIDFFMQSGSLTFVNAEHIWVAVIFSLAVYGPLLAGLTAVGIEGGQRGISEWFAKALHWRVGLRWYWLALLIALALVFIPVAVGGILGLVKLRPPDGYPSILLVLVLFVHQVLTSGLGEEPGWRGFLLPHWQASIGQEKAILWTGVIWALWHFPFTIYYTFQGVAEMGLTAQISVVLPSLIGQIASLIGMSYIYAWLDKGSHSVLIAIFFHALTNLIIAFGNAILVINPMVSLLIAAMPWLVVLVLERIDKSANKISSEAV